MNSMEKSMLLDELFALCKADKEREAKLLEKLDRMTEQLMNLNESSQAQVKVIDGLKQMIASRDILIEKLQKENAALKEQKKQDRKNLYGSKSQKISRKKKEEAPSHEENKDDFDGTSGPSSVSASDEDALSQAPEKKEERPYRKGMSYRRMKADKSVCHDSDFSRLPKDAVIIKTFYKYSYQQISYILEHKYQVIRYKQSDGKIREGYFPKAGEPDYIDVVPGTHASADFLAHLAFNHFVLNVPYYREMYRISDHKMSLSRMTLVNWLAKGAAFTSALIERLKDRAIVYFAYQNDGRYDIDNSIAERFIRPQAGERKNSPFLVNSCMANVSATYHTLMSTCRMNRLSALEYLKKFFHEIVKGKKDYENLLPITIGLNTINNQNNK